MKAAIQQHRLGLCQACLAYRTCPEAQMLADSEAQCPLDPPLWFKVSLMESLSARQYGDAFAVVAQPLARSMDAVLGTKITNCGDCKKRRNAMNEVS
jgi:hypothetical protein